MEATEGAGTLADALRAVRRVQSVITPAWLRVGQTICVAAWLAALYGSGVLSDIAVFAWVALLVCWLSAPVDRLVQRWRGVRSMTRPPGWSAPMLAFGGGAILLVAGHVVTSDHLPGGTFTAYAARFVIALAVVGAVHVAYSMQNTRRVGRVDGPVALIDDVISPRSRVMICAALTQAAQVRSDVLARALTMDTPTLSEHLSRLGGVGHIDCRPDQRDPHLQWVRLTASGRTAYDGHMCTRRRHTRFELSTSS
ncbi:winged helix-turn-helix transcriptional regulator [Gordonia sp. TBRC 11910]|uniref:Winged helix-turn-helix transcriptional regulator n=1 Tax=Gordonia asplenii TaxID=2725283 RepID=A0A848L8L9_9ACTN|nr:MarR family winged helix-turn-helix transcriptional regulator [Gordonia asplenii]NMO05103.1 winged helix-turn-helix transcriptional regulator [Gordonia asplenii]